MPRLAMLTAAAFAASAAAQVKIMLATDIGTDFDDCMALFYLLSLPRSMVDLRGVQVETYNTTQRAQIVASILNATGRLDVPIGVGPAWDRDDGMPEYPIAAGVSLDAFVQSGGTVVYGNSLLAAEMAASTPAAPLYVVEIAPASSLGSVLAANASLAAAVNVVAMSGSVYHGYGNSSSPSAEYNVVQDIASSQYVYNSTWLSPLVTAPLDTTVFDQFLGPTYDILLAANDSSHVFAQALLQHYQVWYDNGGKGYYAMQPFSPTTGTSTMYDVQAAWTAVQLGLGVTTLPLVFQSLTMSVNGGGYTIIDPAGRPVQAAVGFNETAYAATAVLGAQVLSAIVAGGQTP